MTFIPNMAVGSSVLVEQVLREHAGKLAAVDLMFNTEFLSASQCEPSVPGGTRPSR